MNQKFLNLLIKWNNGIKRGAQVKMAKTLEIKESIVSMWVSGAQVPGEANILKMSAILGVSVQQLNKIFNRTPRVIGPGLELAPQVDTSFVALYHAGEVIFLNEEVQSRVEKGEPIKINVKIADDGFTPRLKKGQILVIDTQAKPKLNSILLTRKKADKGSDNKYMLCNADSYDFGLQEESEKKESNTEIIGCAVEVITVEKL